MATRGWRRLRKYGWLGGAAAALGATLTLAMPWRAEIAPVARPAADLYSAATIERGRRVALAGDCAVCHTAPGGVANAGGHALQTPFGTVYSTNITPDEKTGIGNWSYAAFERAMREGIHRDGRHLYPAFPYTAFAKISEADMQRRHPAVTFGGAFLLQLFAAYFMGHVLATYGHPPLGIDMMVAMGLALAFIVTAFGVNYLFAGRSVKLFAIDAGYFLVTYSLMGLIFGFLG